MKGFVHFLYIALLASMGVASAQTCPVLGNMMSCQPGATNQNSLGGGHTPQRLGGMTYYNHTNPQAGQGQGLPQSNQHRQATQQHAQPLSNQHPQAALQHGLPQANQQAGNVGNEVAKQRIGKTGSYSSKPCQPVGTMTDCNAKLP